MTDKRLRLTTVTRTQGANRALKDHTVQPRGAYLEFEEVPVLVHAFRRMVRELQYDVCEMAITTYVCARAHGVPITALPVFLVRGFHHGAVVRRAGRPIEPAELAGARVGVNRGYTVTTGVWARAILADEYGLDLDRVTWLVSDEDHVADYRPPGNVERTGAGEDLMDLLDAGSLAAVIGVKAEPPRTAPLVNDPDEAALRALAERGFYPINHLVVVRDELLQDRPELAADLFEAFTEAKDQYVDGLRHMPHEQRAASDTGQDAMLRQVMAVTGGDPLPYGIGPNRAMIETLIDHAQRQHILPPHVTVEELFAPATLDLVP